MLRSDILDTAKTYVTKDRAATHGKAEDSFAAIAGGWNWWLSIRQSGPLTAHDVAMMMGLFKDARVAGNLAHLDNYQDGVGYRALAGEIATTEKEMRCAECDCEGGGADCNWIAVGPDYALSKGGLPETEFTTGFTARPPLHPTAPVCATCRHLSPDDGTQPCGECTSTLSGMSRWEAAQ